MNLNTLTPEQLAKIQELLTPKMSKFCPWEPTPKQAAFLLMNNHKEVLYGGAAGGGKSVVTLMSALQYVDVPKYSALIIRRTFADLNQPGALLDMAKEWLSPWTKTGVIHWSDKDKKYTFPSGATLQFGYLETENDKYRYQGAVYQSIHIDEVTQIVPAGYTYLFSRLRKPANMPVPLRVRATSNPGGFYHDYYYNRFFIEGPGKGRIFMGAKLDDNPHLDIDAYKESLSELNALEQDQLLHGNWEARETGNMFDRKSFNEIRIDEMPVGMRLVRYWDMASSDVKKNKRADTTVGCLLGYYNGMYFIKDFQSIQGSPAAVEKLMYETALEDGKRVAIRIEKEPGSSGDFVEDQFAKNVFLGYDFKGIRSTGSKAERAKPISTATERGKVYIASHIKDKTAFYDQAEVFPNGQHDDFVDAFTGASAYFNNTTSVGNPTQIGNKPSYWRNVL